MTTELSIGRVVHETYAAHYVLTALGFDPSEIFVGTPNVLNGDPPGTYASVFVRRDGRQFVYNIARLFTEADCARYLKAFHAFALAQPSMERAELDRIARRSNVWRRKASFIAALLQKGFELRPGAMAN
jgi:hypothetical protein